MTETPIQPATARSDVPTWSSLEEALAPAEEAVGIYRRLAEANPAAYLPDLAMSLAARATTLRGLDVDLAISSMEEAVGYWMQLAEQVPAAFGPWLVRGMTALADLLEDAGRVADAEEIRVALNPRS